MKYTLKTTDANGHPLTAPIDSARREGAAYVPRTIETLRCNEHLRAVLRGENRSSRMPVFALHSKNAEVRRMRGIDS